MFLPLFLLLVRLKPASSTKIISWGTGRPSISKILCKTHNTVESIGTLNHSSRVLKWQHKLPCCDGTQYFIQYQNSYLNIFHTLVFHSVRVSFERDSVCLFHPELILSEDAVNCGEADGIYASKKMIILNHSPLNLLQADYIICNYHVYKFPLLLLRQKP